MRVLALTRKPDSPSFEQRVLRHVEPLRRRGVEVDAAAHDGRRVPAFDGFDAVWWHRGLLGPGGLLALRRRRRAGVPVVLDFDDPLPFSAKGGGRPSLVRRVKFDLLARHVDAAMPASGFLASLVTPRCGEVTVVPMAIDLPEPPAESPAVPRPDASDAGFTLLWVGSPATQPYLEAVVPGLRLAAERAPGLRLRLVSHAGIDGGPLRVDHAAWSHDAEAAAFAEADAGLCPMPDTLWTRGKCPFKALQYMAHALPWIGSRVGENLTTAGDGERAVLVDDRPEAWADAVVELAGDAARRRAMGAAGRAYVEAHHARDAVAGQIAGVFERVVAAAGRAGAAR